MKGQGIDGSHSSNIKADLYPISLEAKSNGAKRKVLPQPISRQLSSLCLTLRNIANVLNKFFIDEIQSKNGYILFRAANRNFMVSVSKVDAKSAIIKVVPADNNYFFPLGILTNFYKYIDLNINTPIENLG